MGDRIEITQTSLDEAQVSEAGVVTAESAAEPVRWTGGPRGETPDLGVER